MKERIFIMQILLLIQVIFLASSQELNIKKIGGANFANVNVFSGFLNEDVIAFMSTSGLPNSDQKILYDIVNNDDFKTIHNGTQILNLTEYYANSSIPTNYTYKKFSGQSYFYDGTWYSIIGKNYLEMFGFEGTYDFITLEKYFGFQNYVEFGDIVKFQTFHDSYLYHSHIFPFIIETENSTKIVLISIISGDLLEFNSSRLVFEKECGKSKVISCFTNQLPWSMIICLYKNVENQLEAILLNQKLEEEGKTYLSAISNSSENENIFFKGIAFHNDSSVIAYYTNYNDEYLRIEIKRLDYDEYDYPILANYFNNSMLLIDSTKFNKHYLLNDLVKLNNDDIYFVASSDDRETLYIIILKINDTSINKRIITIDLFKDYKLKFYNDLKLVTYFNNSVAMGFSHCNTQKCEEKSYHSTSIAFLNEFKEDFDYDLIQNLYDSNYNQSSPIIVDFNVYKKNIFGLKFKSIIFLDIQPGLNLIIPGNNTEAFIGVNYDFSSFILNISLNATGKFYITYNLIMDDSVSSSNLRRLLSEEKTVHFFISIDKVISDSCDDKCSLCSTTDPNDCISCKYDYSFVGDKKYCFDKNGDLNMSQIGDLYNNVLENIEDQKFVTIKKENVILQLTTVEDQLSNNSKYVSSIDLGECETLLRVQEGLEDDEDFIIVKMDLKNNSISATYVQYELYNPQTLQKVNMDICKDVTIKIHTPVTLEESQFSLISSLEDSGYNAFDLKDDFYNDICSTYTAENGADMVLSFRKSLIYDQNKEVFLCQSGCEFESYSTKNGRAECNCKVQSKNTETDITKISFDKAKLVDSFYKTLFNSNFRVLKCVKLLLSKKGLKSNIGNYVMDVLLGLFIAFIVIHLLTGQKKIMDIINSALKSKGIDDIKIDSPKENKKDKTQEKNNDKKEENNKKEIEKEELKVNENNEKTKEANANQGDRKKKKRKSSKRHKSKEKDKKIDEPQFPPKKRKSRKSIKKENLEGVLVNTKTDLVNNKGQRNDTDIKEKKKDNHNTENKEEKPILESAKGLNDQEMNTLDYEIACDIDHRTYFQYYFSLLKKKQLILFTFWPMDDYNLTPMKILLFIVSFSLYFTINAFFFTDETMNKIYEDDAAFNFIYQLPQIFYSSVISAIINMVLKLLSLSEKKVLEIKKEKDLDKAKEKADKIKKGLNITLIIFIILSSLLMLFFWYFISCFCAVYNNTQSILITDTIISFLLSMLYPFALNLLPGFLRIPALRAPNRDQKYKYKISGYVALI